MTVALLTISAFLYGVVSEHRFNLGLGKTVC